jgi:hypothetical protein
MLDIKNFFIFAFLLTASVAPSSGQVATTSTVLASPLSSGDQFVNLASATGVTAPGPLNATVTVLMVEQEAMRVLSVNGRYIGVERGSDGTRASAHLSGATVWVGPPGYFPIQDPVGACAASQQITLPQPSWASGRVFACLGGQWVSGTTGPSGTGATSIAAYGAVGNGTTNSNSAISAAFTAAATTGSSIYVPAAAAYYKIDNSAGPLVITGFTGRIWGDGKASRFSCTTLANDCLKFTGASNTILENLAFSYAPAATIRNGAQLLTIDSGSNVTLKDLELFNGNSSGLFINKSDKISTRRIYVHGMLANGIFLTNSTNSSIEQTIGSGNGDALVETSFFDSQVHACDNLTITDLVSTGDVSGILINGCTNVSASNLAITGSTGAGIYVRQDSLTTTAHWPDGTVINGATISAPALQGILISADTSGAAGWTVSLSNIVIRNSTLDGVSIASSTPINSYLQLALNNITVDGTAGASVGYRFNGTEVTGANLTARRTGLYSFLDEAAAKLSLSNLVSENPNQNASDIRAVVVISTGYAVVDGLTLIDTQTTERSNIDDVSASGVHRLSGISTSITNSGFTATSSNTGTVFAQLGFSLDINARTGASYTLLPSDNGKVVTLNNATAITLTVPAGLGAGFNCVVIQLGAGAATFTASSTTIHQRQSLTATAGQYAVARLTAYAADTFALSGDLQ